MKSYYEILGVKENASQQEIKEKYREHALKMHPDRLTDRPKDEVEKIQKQFQEITNAYQTLSDEKEREKYDYQRKSSFGFDGFNGGHGSGFGSNSFGGSEVDLEDIFESFFGGNRNKSSRSWSSGSYSDHSSKAKSLEVVLTISFKDPVVGSTKNFSLDLMRFCSACQGTGSFSSEDVKVCSNCNGKGSVEVIRRTFLGSMRTHSECTFCKGSGKVISKRCITCKGSKIVRVKGNFEVKIPRGIKPGQRITLKSKGNDELNKTRGDVVIEIELKKHPFFERKDNEIHCSVVISFLDAIIGNKVKVPTLEGIQEITVPKYSQVGDYFILKSKGFYSSINSDKRGDLFVWFEIKLPKRISSQAEMLIREIYELSSWNPNEDFIKKLEV